jgi:hypothetical protein
MNFLILPFRRSGLPGLGEQAQGMSGSRFSRNNEKRIHKIFHEELVENEDCMIGMYSTVSAMLWIT